MGLAAAGVLTIGAAVFLGCRLFQVRATLPVLLVLSVLVAAGAVNASAFPGLSQLDDANTALQRWSDRQAERAGDHNGQLAALEAGDVASAEANSRDCACIGSVEP